MTVYISQCGNLAIFLPLWFYVKSILADFQTSETVISTISGALNLIFGKNCSLEHVKMAVLGLQYDHNWFHVKSEWQNSHEMSTLYIPN